MIPLFVLEWQENALVRGCSKAVTVHLFQR